VLLLLTYACGVASLQDRIEALETSLKDNVADLQGKIDEAEATHNSTRDGLLQSMEELKSKLSAQDAVEKQAEASTDSSIDEFKTDLNGLDAFKADSEKSAAELVKKLSVCRLFLLSCFENM
jgi:chromosome segregation ATPase